jgi:uncharacterized DUF497 family protein
MADDAKLTYHFDLDPVKARRNLADHKVSFRLATTVFRDALALTVFDEEHSENEERWATFGQGAHRGCAGNQGLRRHTALAVKGKGEAMKQRYDFSKGERGKFYRPNAVFKLPVYLDEEVQNYLATTAERKGIELSELVNDLLKKEIDIIETVK